MKEKMTYKKAGVDVRAGELFVDRLKTMVKSTYHDDVVAGVGGFACLYKIDSHRYLAAGTDGVGTKLKIAQTLNIHDTIGIDLVAMCVNDVICTGARPLFFLDYLATGKLEIETSCKIIEGIVEGCTQSNMALIGGETAEMPDMYSPGEYDLAGFAVGEVFKEQLIDGSQITTGNTIIGIASSGLHSNGFSLVRKLISNNETEILKKCLTPTRIYHHLVQQLMANHPDQIVGLAHITGGGFTNIARLNSLFNYQINSLPDWSAIPEIFSLIKKRSELDTIELYSTFNMGVGLAIITNSPQQLCSTLDNIQEKYWILGQVTEGNGVVKIFDQELKTI